MCIVLVNIIVSNSVQIADKLVLLNEDVCVEKQRFHDIKDGCTIRLCCGEIVYVSYRRCCC